MTTTAIIQARTGSSRLPNKILKTLCGKTVLDHVINRVSLCGGTDKIIVATTDLPEDIAVCDTVKANGKADVFRGSSSDVLGRYYNAAKESGLRESDIIIRVTSDCPLIDPQLCEDIIMFYKSHNYRYVSNAGADAAKRRYPRGLDCEVFGFDFLEEACFNAVKPFEREHVTPYMYMGGESVYFYGSDNEEDYSHLRWTLDTAEDFLLIQKIYNAVYREDKPFSWRDVLTAYEREWEKINAEIEQKKVV